MKLQTQKVTMKDLMSFGYPDVLRMLVSIVFWFEVPDIIRYQIRRFRKKKIKKLSGTPVVVNRVILCSDLCTTCIKVKKICFATHYVYNICFL